MNQRGYGRVLPIFMFLRTSFFSLFKESSDSDSELGLSRSLLGLRCVGVE
jgi:hypothetical protein